MSQETRKITKEVEALKDEIVEFTVELVKAKSDNPPGLYDEISKVTANKWKELGFDVKVIQIPTGLVKKAGLKTPRTNVLATMKGTNQKPTLALQPHLDAVPPGTGWTVDPYGGEIKDGWIYGRGVADCKGDMVAYTYALIALMNADVKLKGSAIIVGSVDEETGGHLGAKYLLDERILEPDMAIVEGPSHAIWNAANGGLTMSIATIGKMAHSSYPLEGTDALRKMNRVLSSLYDYQARLLKRKSIVPAIGHPLVTPSVIHGGVKAGVLCERCELIFSRGIIPEEDEENVEKEITEILDGLMMEDPEMKIDSKRLSLAKSSGPVSAGHVLIQSIKNAAKIVFNEDIPVIGVPGVSDARFYWERGIPFAHYGASPLDTAEAHLHAADERLPIKDLMGSTKVLALAIKQLIG